MNNTSLILIRSDYDRWIPASIEEEREYHYLLSDGTFINKLYTRPYSPILIGSIYLGPERVFLGQIL